MLQTVWSGCRPINDQSNKPGHLERFSCFINKDSGLNYMPIIRINDTSYELNERMPHEVNTTNLMNLACGMRWLSAATESY